MISSFLSGLSAAKPRSAFAGSKSRRTCACVWDGSGCVCLREGAVCVPERMRGSESVCERASRCRCVCVVGVAVRAV